VNGRDRRTRGRPLVRNRIRAAGLVIVGLLIAGFWPLALALIGVGSVGIALWVYRTQRVLATPYLVAGGLLLSALAIVLLVTPTTTGSTLLPPQPTRTVR
jgi:hypothetical protein